MQVTQSDLLELLKGVCPDGFEPRIEQSGIDPKYIMYFFKEVDFFELRKKDQAIDILATIKEQLEDMVRSHPVYQKLLELHVNETENLKEDLGQLESENERLRRFETHYHLEHNLRHGGDKHESIIIPSGT